MSAIPQTIDIMAHHFAISVQNPGGWGDGEMGHSSLPSQEILILKDMRPDAMLSTLFHEAIHMASAITDVDLSESQISVAAVAALSVFKAMHNAASQSPCR